MISIRPATPEDAAAIDAVHQAAFPSPAEARLVRAICEAGDDAVSLVAVDYERVIGHILFSPITITREQHISTDGLGLAPVAVLPEFQRRGVGSALIVTGLDALRASGCPYVVVLGEPEYYRRFGFATASKFNLQNEYGVDEPFMVQELLPGSLPRGGGLVKYCAAFGELE